MGQRCWIFLERQKQNRPHNSFKNGELERLQYFQHPCWKSKDSQTTLQKKKKKNLPRMLYPAKLGTICRSECEPFQTCKVQEIQYSEVFQGTTDKCATTKMKYIFMKEQGIICENKRY